MEFKINVVGTSAHVHTPYHPGFVEKIKLMTGKWDAQKGAWLIDASAINAVRAAMREEYGRDDQYTGEMVTVKLTFNRYKIKRLGAVTVLGRVLARAYGRDSGAKPGEGVIYLEGFPTSGGSVKNWYSEVTEGSVVDLPGIPKEFAENFSPPDYMEVEITPDKIISIMKLLEEKWGCEARIKEIDAILGTRQIDPAYCVARMAELDDTPDDSAYKAEEHSLKCMWGKPTPDEPKDSWWDATITDSKGNATRVFVYYKIDGNHYYGLPARVECSDNLADCNPDPASWTQIERNAVKWALENSPIPHEWIAQKN